MTAETASTRKPDPEHGGPKGGRPRGERPRDSRPGRFDFSALGSLMSYLWTANSFELRARVVGALILLVGAMSANVYLPILYKGAVDVLDAEAGQVLALPGSITPHTKFQGEVYILSKEEGGRHTPFFNGYRPQFFVRTTDVTGVVTLPEGTEMVMPGDNVTIDVELITPVAVEQSSLVTTPLAPPGPVRV